MLFRSVEGFICINPSKEGFIQFLRKTTRRGEDWDLINNAVKGGLEVERNRSLWVYHYYYYAKPGMWNIVDK